MVQQRLSSGSWPVSVAVVSIAVVSVSSGCKAPRAFGDRHSVIVRADSALWSSVDSTLLATIEQRVYTTRPERKFKVTFIASNDTLWRDLRLWQQVLILGGVDDEVARRVLRASNRPDASPPAVVQARDLWARGQIVTLLLLPVDGAERAVGPLLPELYPLLEEQYTEWVMQRMYASGVNDSLVEALSSHGFTLQLPRIYEVYRLDSVIRFRNAYPDPSTLLRSILVSWKRGLKPVDAEALRAWRQAIAHTRYDPRQDVLDEHLRFDSVSVGELRGVELRGVWRDRTDLPAAGPFIARALSCSAQDRTYYFDAWLYAPRTDKYPYVRQLELLLDSFRCTEIPAPQADRRRVGAAAAR